MSAPSLRIFLAHPSKLPDLAQLKARTQALLATRFSATAAFTLVTGEEDYNARFVREGGWDGWCRSVAVGREYRGMDLHSRFDGFVVAPTRRVGKATATIVWLALQARKPVRFFDGDGCFEPVTLVNTLESHDFSGGWEVITGIQPTSL